MSEIPTYPNEIEDRDRAAADARLVAAMHAWAAEMEAAPPGSATAFIAAELARRMTDAYSPPPALPTLEQCHTCGAQLLFSARARGNGLCGPCTRTSAAGLPPEPVPQPPPANPPRGEFRPSTAPTVAADLRAFAAYLEKADADERQYAAEDLNALLDRWHDDDAFGTEGQLDPRGDHRS